MLQLLADRLNQMMSTSLGRGASYSRGDRSGEPFDTEDEEGEIMEYQHLGLHRTNRRRYNPNGSQGVCVRVILVLCECIWNAPPILLIF